MFVLKLGLLNLLRNPRRSLLSLGAIIAGVAVYIMGTGFVSGMRENIVRAQIDTLSGHGMARPADYPTDGRAHPLDDLYALDAGDRAWLDEHTTGWTRRVQFSPDVISGEDSLRLRAIGYEPNRDSDVFPRKDWGVDGEIPTTADQGVLMGKGPAKLLDLHPGDFVTLRVRTTQGAINALEVPVAGVLATGSPAIDFATVLMPWTLSDQLIRHGDATSHVAFLVEDRDQVDATATAMSEQLGDGVEVITWQSETADLMMIMDLRQQVLNFLSLILLAMAATGIANTILMAAYERMREVGTLQAMGMTRARVVQLFVWEGTVLGVVGGSIGAALGGAGVYNWSTNGIDMSSLIEQAGDTYGSVPMSVMLYTDFSTSVLALGLAVGVVVAMLASVYPAIVASRMNPADAVRA